MKAIPSINFLAAALLAAIFTGTTALPAQPATLTVQTDQPGAKLNPAMWGVFFEDINLGADGGIYAELVKNRSFEFPDALMGWRVTGPTNSVEVRTENPFSPVQPHYLRARSGAIMANEGFRGIGVKAGETYDFSVEARAVEGRPVLNLELVAADGRSLASAKVKGLKSGWTRLTAKLKSSTGEAKAHLNVSVEGGTADVDLVSLFPRHTWKNRPGGLRADMVQWLADLKPGFLRFPGGCIVEGHTLTNRYQWKTTIGPVAERKLILNRWNDEFKHRPAPDYFQSFGLGFFEYFQLCEDIGAQPLPILNCGMACQYNSGELCPLDQLDPYIQDALDLIEFANGPADSVWGAKRAAMGHPRPFGLKMLGVGNEQWDQQYIDRYAKFHAALKAKHPEIKLVAAAGPGPDGKRFDFAWKNLRELQTDIVDEHCYANPDWFYNAVHRYDQYDRQGPKVFFGEYAAHGAERNNDLESALAEAACMTGLERNGDVVCMASYAPLFAHIDGWQWKPDLIWVDNLQSYGTPNYYVQKLFANNAGDVALPVTLSAPAGTKLYASATRDNDSGETILKVVNAAHAPAEVELNFAGAKKVAARAVVCTLTGASPKAENSFAEPLKVSPVESKLKINSPKFSHVFPADSLTVLRLKITN